MGNEASLPTVPPTERPHITMRPERRYCYLSLSHIRPLTISRYDVRFEPNLHTPNERIAAIRGIAEFLGKHWDYDAGMNDLRFPHTPSGQTYYYFVQHPKFPRDSLKITLSFLEVQNPATLPCGFFSRVLSEAAGEMVRADSGKEPPTFSHTRRLMASIWPGQTLYFWHRTTPTARTNLKCAMPVKRENFPVHVHYVLEKMRQLESNRRHHRRDYAKTATTRHMRGKLVRVLRDGSLRRILHLDWDSGPTDAFVDGQGREIPMQDWITSRWGEDESPAYPPSLVVDEIDRQVGEAPDPFPPVLLPAHCTLVIDASEEESHLARHAGREVERARDWPDLSDGSYLTMDNMRKAEELREHAFPQTQEEGIPFFLRIVQQEASYVQYLERWGFKLEWAVGESPYEFTFPPLPPATGPDWTKLGMAGQKP